MQILESTLGPNHPRIAIVAANLGAILREKPDLAGARRAYARALAIDEPHTALIIPKSPPIGATSPRSTKLLRAVRTLKSPRR